MRRGWIWALFLAMVALVIAAMALAATDGAGAKEKVIRAFEENPARFEAAAEVAKCGKRVYTALPAIASVSVHGGDVVFSVGAQEELVRTAADSPPPFWDDDEEDWALVLDEENHWRWEGGLMGEGYHDILRLAPNWFYVKGYDPA